MNGPHMMDHPDHLSLDQQHLVASVTSRLESQFAGIFGRETIERFVLDGLDLASVRPIRDQIRGRVEALMDSLGIEPA